ncbi:MAG: DNA repair protein RecO [Alphaproteobacteria bacterium]|nr:DNA repair protein RecO [Alphaproteobacteria bacterium]
MDWIDEGIVLGARRHGESGMVVSLLTQAHGRHAGLVRGGAGRRGRALYEPGNRLRAVWKARLSEHLGSYACELIAADAATLLDDAGRLAALSSACALVEAALPEREPHPSVFASLGALIRSLSLPNYGTFYVRWELALLAELGFALDLESCAATGANDDLAYVSPKSGRAVSAAAAEPYRRRLLPLPRFLIAPTEPGALELVQGLRLTGHFLDEHVFAHRAGGMPAARVRLAERLARNSTERP